MPCLLGPKTNPGHGMERFHVKTVIAQQETMTVNNENLRRTVMTCPLWTPPKDPEQDYTGTESGWMDLRTSLGLFLWCLLMESNALLLY